MSIAPAYCIGEKADGMTILVAWVTRVSAPPPGGHRPSATAFFRVAIRASRLG